MLAKLFIYLDIAGPLLGLCIFLIRNAAKAGGCIYLLAYLMLQLLANGLAKYLMLTHASTNIWVYQANAFFSLIVVSLWFLQELKRMINTGQLRWLCWYALAAVCLMVPIIIFEDASALNSLSLSFTSFSICLYCVIFYISSLTSPNETNLLQSGSFWIVTAFFLYYSTCFFIYVSYKIFTKNGNLHFPVLWSIHNLILFISCCILAVSCKKTKKWK